MITFLALSLLVILHELGHFITAKLFGVRVEEFGLGLPPKAKTLGKWHGTEYTLNWLPLGGFVRLYGEQGELSTLEEINPLSRKVAFTHKPIWQRAIILSAGIVSNLLIGIAIFSVIYTVIGIPQQVGEQVVISKVVPGSPADLSGMIPGQVVVRVKDQEIATSDQFVTIITDSKGEQVNLYLAKVQPDGTTTPESEVVVVTPRENPPEGEGALGVAVATVPIMKYDKKPWYSAPFYGAVEGIKESYLWSREIFSGIVALFGNLVTGQIPEGLSGPIGVVRVGNEAQGAGILVYLRFVAIISINLGIFNLFPIPALDGGRLAFLVIEKIVGKRHVAKVEGYINGVGFLLLIGLLILVTILDIL
jgi:regulator of sigma E protease